MSMNDSIMDESPRPKMAAAFGTLGKTAKFAIYVLGLLVILQVLEFSSRCALQSPPYFFLLALALALAPILGLVHRLLRLVMLALPAPNLSQLRIDPQRRRLTAGGGGAGLPLRCVAQTHSTGTPLWHSAPRMVLTTRGSRGYSRAGGVLREEDCAG